MAEDDKIVEPVVQNDDNNDNDLNDLLDNDDQKSKDDQDDQKTVSKDDDSDLLDDKKSQTPKEEMIPKSALKKLKERLDAAFAQRDEIMKKLKAYEQKEAQERQKKLIEEGKVKEAYESQISEFHSKVDSLERENDKLLKNIAIRDALKPYTFRNEKAALMTLKTLEDSFIKGDDGRWISADGNTVEEAVKAFVESEENAFLFKRKENSGSGISNVSNTAPNPNRRLAEMSNDEIIAMYKRKLRS